MFKIKIVVMDNINFYYYKTVILCVIFLSFIFGLEIAYLCCNLYAQDTFQNQSSVLELSKDKIVLNIVKETSRKITIEFYESYEIFGYNPPEFDITCDPNTIIIEDPNRGCCVNTKLNKSLIFPILKLPKIEFDYISHPSTSIPLSFSFDPPLDINRAYLRYYTCQYDREDEDFIWADICDDFDCLKPDLNGKIIIYLADLYEDENWDNYIWDNYIIEGIGDKNMERGIISHMGAFILLSASSEGRCFLNSLF